MAAAKNLKAGDIIFRERALAVGPKQGCLPVCLTCYAGFPEAGSNEPVYRCPGCNFPFCGETCAKVISIFKKNIYSKSYSFTILNIESGSRS